MPGKWTFKHVTALVIRPWRGASVSSSLIGQSSGRDRFWLVRGGNCAWQSKPTATEAVRVTFPSIVNGTAFYSSFRSQSFINHNERNRPYPGWSVWKPDRSQGIIIWHYRNISVPNKYPSPGWIWLKWMVKVSHKFSIPAILSLKLPSHFS